QCVGRQADQGGGLLVGMQQARRGQRLRRQPGVEGRRQGREGIVDPQLCKRGGGHGALLARRARAARLAGRTYKMADRKNTADSAISRPANAADSGAGSDMARTTPSIRYSSTSMAAHWKV